MNINKIRGCPIEFLAKLLIKRLALSLVAPLILLVHAAKLGRICRVKGWAGVEEAIK